MTDTIIKAWGGFVNGRLYCLPPGDPRYHEYDEPRYAIFKTRVGAKRAYGDVRRVEIVIRERT